MNPHGAQVTLGTRIGKAGVITVRIKEREIASCEAQEFQGLAGARQQVAIGDDRQ
jgi:hypothetical protein